MDHQDTLLEIVHTWNISELPEYRRFRCANCQTHMQGKVWHHLLDSAEFLCPVHLCDSCEQLFQAGEITTNKPIVAINHAQFGRGQDFSEEAYEAFTSVITDLQKNHEVMLKEFTCDYCSQSLAIDEEGFPHGWHVWWKIPETQTLAELHFDKPCGEKLKIER